VEEASTPFAEEIAETSKKSYAERKRTTCRAEGIGIPEGQTFS